MITESLCPPIPSKLSILNILLSLLNIILYISFIYGMYMHNNLSKLWNAFILVIPCNQRGGVAV